IVSEVKVTLDKEESKKQDGVRSQSNFGQGGVKKARWCPKPRRHLWTGRSQKSKKIPKSCKLLTRRNQKEQERVRSRCTFGQVAAKKLRTSPKQCQVRNKSGEISINNKSKRSFLESSF
ncbi:hypothetical protein, partial [Neobacillus sp. LXY-1]|uniref:hypothetical protein n=1 Tax=Neobacillus sp. LXY-1 TaxID=3379133 RepID=UPI003EDF5951